MHSLSRALAVEGAPYNVTANTVAPGVIMTENIMNRLTDKQFEDEIAAVPLNRGGSPEEIAQVILNTVNSGFITGETINVNGGAFMGA
jgi:NAD(P)-dependent dehydrogenase (short-subunit alcohol dehydrogenase family)